MIHDVPNTASFRQWPAANPQPPAENGKLSDVLMHLEPADRVTIHASNYRQPGVSAASEIGTPEPGKAEGPGEKEGLSFWDVLDVVNPLQHIPVIGNIYRSITGDGIRAPARILGGGLFGGVIGAVAGAVNSIISKVSGKDIGEHVLGALNFGNGGQPVSGPSPGRTPAIVDPGFAQPSVSGKIRMELPGTAANFSALRALLLGENETVRPKNEKVSPVPVRTGARANGIPAGDPRRETHSADPPVTMDDAVSAALNYHRTMTMHGVSPTGIQRSREGSQLDVIG